MVFDAPIAYIEELKSRTEAAVFTIIEEMLKNNGKKLEHHLDILQAIKGVHIEVY